MLCISISHVCFIRCYDFTLPLQASTSSAGRQRVVVYYSIRLQINISFRRYEPRCCVRNAVSWPRVSTCSSGWKQRTHTRNDIRVRYTYVCTYIRHFYARTYIRTYIDRWICRKEENWKGLILLRVRENWNEHS